MSGNVRVPIRQIDGCRWEVPQDYKKGMQVPGLVFATETLMEQISADNSLDQVANVACLPGIVRLQWPCRTYTGATASQSVASPPRG